MTTTKVPSPCNKICVRGQEGKCKGCLRTMDELTHWRNYSDIQRIEIWKRIIDEGYQPFPEIDLSFLDT
jgi:predicted Fe-S protein YdhL (DUF1289 family)